MLVAVAGARFCAANWASTSSRLNISILGTALGSGSVSCIAGCPDRSFCAIEVCPTVFDPHIFALTCNPDMYPGSL